MMDRSTILIARIMGPALIAFGAALLAGRVDLAALVNALVADATLRLFASAISLILGLVLVVLHNRWRRPPEIAITLAGWILILRGASLLVAPPAMLESFRPLIESTALPWISGGVMLVIGALLAFTGFVSKLS
jgi:hypothetical protein